MPEQQAEERIYNKTFKGIHHLSHLNACVGNNGQPDLPEYAGGFMDAALRLGELVIDNDVENSIDEFIYPIAFNMRHSVEVWLKYFLKQLKNIRSDKLLKPPQNGETEKVITDDDMTQTHNINVFWDWFKFNSETRDLRLVEINCRMDEYIADIGEIDPTGQTFRYPYNTESQKHLVKTPIINLVNLTKRIMELKKLTKELKYLLLELIDEYDTGTYTKNLSRAQLAYISKQIPPKAEWSLPVFDEIKAKLKVELNIGSKEYSKALEIIQNHREFAENIGLMIPLKASTKDELKLFLKSWLVFHHKEEEESVFEEAMNPERFGRERQALLDVIENIRVQSQADIGAVFNLAYIRKYSEDYDRIFEQENREAIFSQKEEDTKWQYIRHFLTKANFVEHLVCSLTLLGQSQQLSELQQEYEVVDKEVKRKCSK